MAACSRCRVSDGRVRRQLCWSAALALACSDPSGPGGGPPPPDVAPFVTGAAATAVSNGQFVLPPPPPDPIPSISLAQAQSLAVAWVPDFAPGFASLIGQVHGSAVNAAILRPCRLTRYAASQFEPVDPAVAADAFASVVVRAVGPQWLIQLCAPSGELQAVLAVSYYSTTVTIVNGHLAFPRVGGNWFIVDGVPSAVMTSLPMSPEEAVVAVAQRVSRRVNTIPELLVRTATGLEPALAVWRLQFEAPFTVHRVADNAALNVSEIYVGGDPGPSMVTLVAAAGQPSTETLQYVVSDTLNQPPNPPTLHPITFTRQPSLPIQFDAVAF